MDNNWCVYMHTFPNNKKYIGITSQRPEYRWNKGNGYKHQKLMNRAIEKYGWENIQTEIINENISKEQAIEKEKYYIQKYQTTNPLYGYNLTEGGEGHNGYSPSLESRQKNRLSNIGQKRSKSFCERLSYVNTGKKLSEETKQKIREAMLLRGSPNISEEGRKRIRENARKVGLANKGRIQTLESNEARSKALKGIKRSEETKQRMRKPKSAEAIANMKRAQQLRRRREKEARVDPGRVGGQ